MAEAGQTEDHRGHDRDLVTLENIGSHAGAVADVVADVVGDGGGVARVVLGDVFLDLAHEVGADVGGLGVDAAAHAHEQRQEGAAEAEAQQRLIGLFAVGDENQGTAEQAEAVGEHAGDGAGAVAELHRLAVGAGGGGGDAQVARRGQSHANEAHAPAEERTDEERAGAAELERDQVALRREEQHEGDDDDERPDLAELGREVGVGAFAHGGGDFLHAGRTLIGGLHLFHEHERVEQTEHRDHEHHHQRHDLHLRIFRVGEQAEEGERVFPSVRDGGLRGGRLAEERAGEKRRRE